MTEKTREQKLRKEAKRQGLIATKGNSKTSTGTGWMIIDGRTNFVVAGSHPYAYCLSLKEAEEYVYNT